MRSIGPAVTREQSPAFLRNSNGRLDLPGPTQEAAATPVTRVRPGHADLAGALKYDFDDVRNVLERASARETTARVAAGGVARRLLGEVGIEIWSFTAEVGGVAVDPER